MPRPGNSNLFRCFLAWRAANAIGGKSWNNLPGLKQVFFCSTLLRILMPRPGNSNLFRCFLAWRAANIIGRKLYENPLRLESMS